MRTMMVFVVLSLITSVCSAGPGMLLHPDAIPYFSTGWEWCPMGIDTQDMSIYFPSPDEHCMVMVNGYNVHITHYDAVYNCCIDDVVISVVVENGIIRIVEKEVYTDPCYCYCYFETYADLYNVPAGDYTVEVWSCWMTGDESLRCAELISVPSWGLNGPPLSMIP